LERFVAVAVVRCEYPARLSGTMSHSRPGTVMIRNGRR
jgi:hypothetical protein